MFGIGVPELILILIVGLVVFGPGKLPEPETILQRLKDDHSRPLLENNKNIEFVQGLMDKRRAKYEAAADIVIHTDGKNVREICDEIIAQLC